MFSLVKIQGEKEDWAMNDIDLEDSIADIEAQKAIEESLRNKHI